MDYSPYIAKAKAKIAKYGCMVSFEKQKSSYDPISGLMDSETEKVEAMALMTRPDKTALASGTIQIGDMCLLVAGDDLPNPPESNAIVDIAGAKWRVASSSLVAPDGTPVLYKIFVRRS